MKRSTFSRRLRVAATAADVPAISARSILPQCIRDIRDIRDRPDDTPDGSMLGSFASAFDRPVRTPRQAEVFEVDRPREESSSRWRSSIVKDNFERLVLLLLTLGLSGSVSAQTWVTTTDDYIADEVGRAIQTR